MYVKTHSWWHPWFAPDISTQRSLLSVQFSDSLFLLYLLTATWQRLVVVYKKSVKIFFELWRMLAVFLTGEYIQLYIWYNHLHRAIVNWLTLHSHLSRVTKLTRLLILAFMPASNTQIIFWQQKVDDYSNFKRLSYLPMYTLLYIIWDWL